MVNRTRSKRCRRRAEEGDATKSDGIVSRGEDVVVLSTSLPNDLHLEVYPVARAKSGRGVSGPKEWKKWRRPDRWVVIPVAFFRG